MYFWNVFIQEVPKQYVCILNNSSVIICSLIIIIIIIIIMLPMPLEFCLLYTEH